MTRTAWFVGLAVLLGGCAISAEASSAPSAPPSIAVGSLTVDQPPSLASLPSAPPSIAVGPLTMDALPSILIQPSEGPPGMSVVADVSTPAPLDTFTQGDRGLGDRFLQLGFQGARAIVFASAEAQLGSAGLIWPDEERAHNAFEAHAAALPRLVVGYADAPTRDLGAESRCGTFEQGPLGSAGAVCLFRVANATFFSPGSGSTIAIDEVATNAQVVATRALEHAG